MRCRVPSKISNGCECRGYETLLPNAPMAREPCESIVSVSNVTSIKSYVMVTHAAYLPCVEHTETS